MRLFAHKLIPCFVTVLWAVSLYAQSNCKCYPDPPNGKTECDETQIAVCGRADDGHGCSGVCVTVDQNLQSVQYAASVISYFSAREVTPDDLRRDDPSYTQIIKNILESNSTGNPTTLVFEENEIVVSIGLPAAAVEKLWMTLDEIGH